MNKQSSPAKRPSIEEVEQQFRQWRKTRPQRSPIPKYLWAGAVRLAQEYSICRIAKTLRLDYNTLKRRVLAEQTENSPQAESSPSFIEFELSSSLPITECRVEIEDRDGAKLKMQLKGPALTNPLDILSAFWSRA